MQEVHWDHEAWDLKAPVDGEGRNLNVPESVHVGAVALALWLLSLEALCLLGVYVAFRVISVPSILVLSSHAREVLAVRAPCSRMGVIDEVQGVAQDWTTNGSGLEEVEYCTNAD